MADIPDKYATEPVRIMGAGDCGVESHPVDASATGELYTSDAINNGGVDGTLSVGAITPVRLQVGTTPLANRKLVIFISGGRAVWGFSSLTQNIPVFKNQPVILPAGPDTELWILSVSGTIDVFVAEGA